MRKKQSIGVGSQDVKELPLIFPFGKKGKIAPSGFVALIMYCGLSKRWIETQWKINVIL